MAPVRLRSTVYSDLFVGGEFLDYHYIRALIGGVSLAESGHEVNFWVQKSLAANLSIPESGQGFSGYIKRALIADLDSDSNDIVSISALRRTNIPVPPQGELWLLSPGGEKRFKRSSVRRGDTILINLIARGDFPSNPNIVFAIKEAINDCIPSMVVKDNIPVLAIEDIQDKTGILHQKLQAQIVIFPGETAKIERSKTLFYTCEIVDQQLDEVYTIETGNFTVLADVHNYFDSL